MSTWDFDVSRATWNLSPCNSSRFVVLTGIIWVGSLWSVGEVGASTNVLGGPLAALSMPTGRGTGLGLEICFEGTCRLVASGFVFFGGRRGLSPGGRGPLPFGVRPAVPAGDALIVYRWARTQRLDDA